MKLNGREIEVAQFDWDAGEVAWATAGYYADTDEELNDLELEQVTDLFQDCLYERAFEREAGRAESYWEGER